VPAGDTAPASPRVLIVRRRAESSRSTVVGFAFFGFFSTFASAAGFGAWSVVAAPGAALARGGRFAPSALLPCARAPASRAARSPVARQLLLALRLFLAQLDLFLIDGRRGRRRWRGASAATAPAVTSFGSRFTNTRFSAPRPAPCGTCRWLGLADLLVCFE